ncbi:MAG: hypothetical protein Q8N96_09755 [Methylovulum sp.]|nr:hypothetical protein [Methylovulum sp.]
MDSLHALIVIRQYGELDRLGVKAKVMKKIAAFCTVFIAGCASGLNSMQQQDLLGYEAKGLSVQEKSTSTATALGFLPGGGSFYTRNYGFGVINLLLWPYSVLWDPVSGYNGTQEINFHATLANVSKLKDAEFAELESQLMTQQIDNNQYLFRKHEVERKYSPTGSMANSSTLNYAPSPTNKPLVKPAASGYKNAPVVAEPAQYPISAYENKLNIQPSRSEGDLRDCLKLQTNEDVIKCTERGR